MPSSIGHGSVAVLANPILAVVDRRPAVLWTAAVAAMLPDIDAINLPFGGGGVAALGGHRAITHSTLVAIAAAALLTPAVKRAGSSIARLFVFFAVVIASHGWLDCFTSYWGVELLAPITTHRFEAPWQAMDGVEIYVLWLPALVMYALNVGGFRRRSRPAE